MTSNQVKKPDEDSLRTEYLACTERIVASGNWAWQSTSIIVGASFAAAAIVLTRIDDNMSPGVVLLLGAVTLLVLLPLPFYFRREKWRQDVLFNRTNEIERRLGLKMSLDIEQLDKIRNKKARSKHEAGVELSGEYVYWSDVERWWKLRERWKSRHGLPAPGPFGWGMLHWWVNVAVLAWLSIVVKAWWGPAGWAFLGVGLLLLASVDYWTWPCFRSPLRKGLKWLIALLHKVWSFVRGRLEQLLRGQGAGP